MRRFTPSFATALLLLALIAQAIPANAASSNDALIVAVNAYRASRGLPTLVASPTLQAAAQFMAEDIASHGPPAVPHRSTDGRMPRQRLTDAGYPISSTTSEIVAWGATGAAGAMNLWLNSPPHLAQLNDGRFLAGGFGVACAGSYPCVWVVTFGSVVDG
ncbi:MAG: CAP domain-containing protein, partial [Chloroflexota bacterium]|nr:CAP domain-containing protein [Chloroflexota bacterium]